MRVSTGRRFESGKFLPGYSGKFRSMLLFLIVFVYLKLAVMLTLKYEGQTLNLRLHAVRKSAGSSDPDRLDS